MVLPLYVKTREPGKNKIVQCVVDSDKKVFVERTRKLEPEDPFPNSRSLFHPPR